MDIEGARPATSSPRETRKRESDIQRLASGNAEIEEPDALPVVAHGVAEKGEIGILRILGSNQNPRSHEISKGPEHAGQR